MIARAVLLILVFASLCGFCMWGIGKEDRGIAFKWVLRGAFCLLFGVLIVVGYALMEGLIQ